MNSLQSTGNPQFSAMYQPDLGGLEPNGQINLDGQKPRLPLWLDHTGNSNAYSEIIQSATSTNMYGLSAPRVLKEEEDSNGNMSSLYYNNINHTPQATSQTHMSATALLQKAATMGSTRSNSSGLFANGFGLMNSCLSNNMNASFSSMNQGRNEVDNLSGLVDTGQLLDPSMMMMMGSNSDDPKLLQKGKSMTRDFLGVGGNNENRSFLQQELANFATMGSAMDLSQYSANGSH